MRKFSLLLVLALVACACTNGRKASVPGNPDSGKELPTRVVGELCKGHQGDSVRVSVVDYLGNETVYKVYPIIDGMFAFNVPTDRMSMAAFLVTYDEGVSSGYFIPEGGRMKVSMTKLGTLRVKSDREGSLTETHNSMARELTDMVIALRHENDSVARARGYSEEQKEQLDAAAEAKVQKKLEEQSLDIVKKNPDNILGLKGIINLVEGSNPSRVRELLKNMSAEIQSCPSIPDSLRN